MLKRARNQSGFGLIELLIAMMVLNIALLAMVAAFTSGTTTLIRAGRTSTATALANSQHELYRALTWSQIRLDATAVAATDSTYQTEPGWSSQVTASCPGPPTECQPSRTATGADGVTYRVDTYIFLDDPSPGRPVKRVVVVVRNPSNLGARPYVRAASVFDESTG